MVRAWDDVSAHACFDDHVGHRVSSTRHMFTTRKLVRHSRKRYVSSMRIQFDGVLVYWKGPSPYHFVEVPENESAELRDVGSLVTYGWGVIPVEASIGASSWTTSLFPKSGRYLVPIKSSIRRAEDLDLGDYVTVRLSISRLGPR